MYSKSADYSPRQYSITSQLTLFYGLCSLLMITTISLFLYGVIVTFLNHADDQFFTDETRILKKLLINKPNDSRALAQEVKEIPTALQSSVYHYAIRVLDEQQKTLAQTPGMDQILLNNDFLSQSQPLSAPRKTTWWQSPIDGRQYFMMKTWVHSPTTDRAWLIQIALDATHQKEMLMQYRNLVYLIVIGGVAISLLMGYVIARKGMRYLLDLTRTTERISAHDFKERIQPELWPKELKNLGKAYNQMLDRIELAISNLVQFSDDLAHELRTPVTNLMGVAEIALSCGSSKEECQQAIGSMGEELNRIYQIIENLLFLARAENPKQTFTKQRLNVHDEIAQIARIYQMLADEKMIQLTYEGKATFAADRVMFQRMIANLLSNAIHYTGHAGKVHVAVSQLAGTVQIVITDNGIGIAEEHLSQLFQRFYRTDLARAQYSGGTGLGLALVKSIVELHQGDISLRSRLNEGTSVIIRFPG